MLKRKLFIAGMMLVSVSALAQMKYPQTKKIDHVDNYHGTQVADPYRWLEDDNSEETKAWVKAQNEVSFGYLNQIPLRDEFKKRIEALSNYEKIANGGHFLPPLFLFCALISTFSSSAAWPVSERNTSSSDGRLRAISSG